MKIIIQLQIGLVHIPLLYIKRLYSGDVQLFTINYGIQTVFIFLRDSSCSSFLFLSRSSHWHSRYIVHVVLWVRQLQIYQAIVLHTIIALSDFTLSHSPNLVVVDAHSLIKFGDSGESHNRISQSTLFPFSPYIILNNYRSLKVWKWLKTKTTKCTMK